MSSSQVEATGPADLNPGDNYRLVFITDAKAPAFSSDPSIYNNHVIGEVAQVGSQLSAFGADWHAIVETTTTTVEDNIEFGLSGAALTDLQNAPIYRINASGVFQRVADDQADLFDADDLLKRIAVDQYLVSDNTRTTFTGIGSNPLGGGLNVTSGTALEVDNDWFDNGIGNGGINQHLFGISDVLQVQAEAAIPEPGTYAMLASALGIPLCLKRRKSALQS